MPVFHKTKHFKWRAKKRGIPIDLETIRFSKVSSGVKKKIRKCCPGKKFDPNHVYFMAEVDGKKAVYVCVQNDINEFTVLTAFDISYIKLKP